MPFLNLDIFDDLPLRLKDTVNPYVKRLVQAQTEKLPVLFGSQLRPMPGRWKEYLSERLNRPLDKLILEIGVHKGKVIQSLAEDHPNYGVLGMDITMKRVVLSAEGLRNAGTENGLVILGNAKSISQIFARNELDGILIFFPDPWTKKKHQIHKRLMDFEFCKQAASVLSETGFFWLKTDCRDYFDQTLAHLSDLGFEKAGANPFGKTYESVFEARFKNKSQLTFEDTLHKSFRS